MNKSLFLISAMAALTMSGLAAEAGCINPNGQPGAVIKLPPQLLKTMAQNQPDTTRNAAYNVVGTWLATYTVEGNPFAQAYIQWHDDGTEWENANLPVKDGNICMGSWKTVDARHVYRNHWGWNYTNGSLSGYFNETETDRVKNNGTYQGTNDIKFYDLSGALQNEVTGTSSAVKITP